jgi:hypothetical protein
MSTTPSNLQYMRRAEVVIGSGGVGIDINQLKIVFRIIKTVVPQPNSATIKIYNLSETNESYIKAITQSEYADIILNAGYVNAMRVLFKGSIKNAYRYRDKTDLVTEIACGDGDADYRNAVMNVTLAAGTTDRDIVAAAVKSFTATTLGSVVIADKQRTRGHAIYGPTRHVLSTLARVHGALWSIQDGAVQMVSATGVLPNQAIVLNSATGLLGVPELTSKGIILTALLNPQFAINGVVKLNNNDIKFKPRVAHVSASGSATRTKSVVQPTLSPDGLYKIIRIDHNGDNLGGKWTSELTCIGVGQSIPVDAVQDSGDPE